MVGLLELSQDFAETMDSIQESVSDAVLPLTPALVLQLSLSHECSSSPLTMWQTHIECQGTIHQYYTDPLHKEEEATSPFSSYAPENPTSSSKSSRHAPKVWGLGCSGGQAGVS